MYVFVNLLFHKEAGLMTALRSFSDLIMNDYHELDLIASFEPIKNTLGNTASDQIRYGKNLQDLLELYQIEGVPGINDWFSHMAQTFVTEGIPLPYAETIQQVTGMPAEQAVEWLSININDLIEIGSEAAIMAFFRKNPKAYSICLVLGIAFGLYSNNTMLVAMNGLQYFSKLRNEQRLQNGLWNGADRFIRTSFSVTGKVCISTFVADKIFDLMGISLTDLAEQVGSVFGIGKKVGSAANLAVEAASTVDIIEGISNFGLSFLVGQAVGKLMSWLNDEVKLELAKVGSLFESKEQLIELIKKDVPPETLVPIIEIMIEHGVYNAILTTDETNKG